MFLGVDIGNSNIGLGLVDGGEIRSFWRVKTDRNRTPDEFRIIINSLMLMEGVNPKEIDRAFVSSVVPPINGIISEALELLTGSRPMFVGPGIKTGLKIRVKNPLELGADRVANAVAAHNLYGGDIIVVDLGTATTFDYITKDGEFMGGAIAPGLDISQDALFVRTAKLPRVEFKRPERVVGRSTVESLQSGIFFGYIYLVKGIVEEMKKEVGREPKVVATGGCIKEASHFFKFIDVFDEFLTIKGLYYISLRNPE